MERSFSENENFIFKILIKEPALLQEVVQFLDSPADYVDLHPVLDDCIFHSSHVYFLLLYSVDIIKLFEQVSSEDNSNFFTDDFIQFLNLIYSTHSKCQHHIIKQLQYLEWVYTKLGFLRVFPEHCFVELCTEMICYGNLKARIYNPEIYISPILIYDKCFCEEHIYWIRFIEIVLERQQEPFPSETLYALCNRFAFRLVADQLQNKDFLFFLPIMATHDFILQERHLVVHLCLVFFFDIMQHNNFDETEFPVDFIIDVIEKKCKPFPIDRSFSNRESQSEDMMCLQAICLEIAIRQYLIGLYDQSGNDAISFVHSNVLGRCLVYLSNICCCNIHSNCTGMLLLQFISDYQIEINEYFFNAAKKRFASSFDSVKILIDIALQKTTSLSNADDVICDLLKRKEFINVVLRMPIKNAVTLLDNWNVPRKWQSFNIIESIRSRRKKFNYYVKFGSVFLVLEFFILILVASLLRSKYLPITVGFSLLFIIELSIHIWIVKVYQYKYSI